jgi:hypothetical protein
MRRLSAALLICAMFAYTSNVYAYTAEIDKKNVEDISDIFQNDGVKQSPKNQAGNVISEESDPGPVLDPLV